MRFPSSRAQTGICGLSARAQRGICTSILALLISAATAQAQTDLVIVSGLGGQPKYVKEFADIAVAIADAASGRAGLPDSAITWLGETGVPASRWFRGASTRENVDRTLARLAMRPGSAQLVVILLGHGAGEGADTRISLPGPDLTAADFNRMLSQFGNRRVAFVNLTSGSGDMLPVLASTGRVVVTATKSAFERNESQFARFFADAFAKDGADGDKDGQVSILEAFRYAEAEVKRFYEDQSRLATEHAQIADEGQLAGRFFLAPGVTVKAAGNTRLAALLAERAALDDSLQALRRRKESMSADAYDRELERLLLALAAKSEEIRKLERGS